MGEGDPLHAVGQVSLPADPVANMIGRGKPGTAVVMNRERRVGKPALRPTNLTGGAASGVMGKKIRF